MLLIRLVLLRMYYLPPWFSLKFRFIITKLLQYFKYHFYYSRKDKKRKEKKRPNAANSKEFRYHFEILYRNYIGGKIKIA